MKMNFDPIIAPNKIIMHYEVSKIGHLVAKNFDNETLLLTF